MIKVVYCFRKLAGISDEDFNRYWRDVHGQLGIRIPRVSRLVQSRAVRFPDDARQPDLDGLAALWC